jgi:hypothetical protein
LSKECFKDQGRNNQDPNLKFRGTIFTDGVGLCVLKTNMETRAGGATGERQTIQRREVDGFHILLTHKQGVNYLLMIVS